MSCSNALQARPQLCTATVGARRCQSAVSKQQLSLSYSSRAAWAGPHQLLAAGIHAVLSRCIMCVQISGCAAGHGSSGGQQAAAGGHNSDGEDGHQELTSALSQHMGSQEEAAGQLEGDPGAAGAAGAEGVVGAAAGGVPRCCLCGFAV